MRIEKEAVIKSNADGAANSTTTQITYTIRKTDPDGIVSMKQFSCNNGQLQPIAGPITTHQNHKIPEVDPYSYYGTANSVNV